MIETSPLNEHLSKDIGLIPYGMHKFLGCDAFFTTYSNNTEDYPNLRNTPGLYFTTVPNVTGDWNRDALRWLAKNAKRIDVLMLYHMNRPELAKGLVYKLLNRRGKIYMRCDGWPMPWRKPIILHPSTYTLLRICDLISTELEPKAEAMTQAWHRRIICLPNPANPNDYIQGFRPFTERSNTIITVGRLGTRQKATEILLEAFVRISSQLPNWTLKLAGRFEQNMNIADDFYAAHPELKERVIFTGEIRDSVRLAEMYRDAKIFAFPSRWESFGIALTEAMMQGCFAVTTNIESSATLTENFRYALGSDIDDVDALANNLLYACTHEAEIESLARQGMEVTRRRCDLKRICDTIASELHLV